MRLKRVGRTGKADLWSWAADGAYGDAAPHSGVRACSTARERRLAWTLFLLLLLGLGASLLTTASLIGGEHGHGRWLVPAKLVGLFLISVAALGIVALLVYPWSRGRPGS
jgi:hypothetical protein